MDMESYFGINKKLDIKEILKMDNLMEEEHNIMEVNRLKVMLMNKILLIKLLLECKKIIGKSIKEILDKIKEMDKEQYILKQENGWVILNKDNQMDRVFL